MLEQRGTIGATEGLRVLFVFVLVAVVVVFAMVAVAVGRIDGMADPDPSVPPPRLPDGPLSAADVDRVRFAVAFRGYRMDQVDAVLDRLGKELARRDSRISALEDELTMRPGDGAVR